MLIFRIHVYTCIQEPPNSLFSQLQVVSPAMFFLRYLGSLRLFFTLVQAYLFFLPPLCFQNKAAVSESMPHLVKANAREKHKAPGFTKFLTTLFPKQPFLDIFYAHYALNMQCPQPLSIYLDMSACKKQLQHVCLCFTAVNTSFI